MKTYPYTLELAVLRQLSYSSKKIILFLLFIGLALLSFAGGGKLDFKNATLESGVNGQDGAVYRFPKVDSDIDALVKISGRSNTLVTLVTIDMPTSGFDKAWQPQVSYNNGTAPGVADWWMEFEMTFVEKGTNTPVTIDEFDLTAIDIDGNGDKIREYVSFYGLQSYILEANTLLLLSNITGLLNGILGVPGKRFDGPTLNYLNIDTSGTGVMTTAKYVKTKTYTLRTGGVSSGVSGASDRMYSLYFKDFSYGAPQQSTLPVALKSFDAKLISGKAMLNWVADAEINFSHYIVERSIDGKNFSNATMIFAAEKQGSETRYDYSELIRNEAALVYYRLKMVDADGSFRYSNIRILKINQQTQTVAISTYPNPVVSELRITIPSQWQDQRVVYDMYNTNGKMVKRQVSNHASQTETLNLSDVQAGTYVIRLSSGTSSAVQQIVKSR